MGVYAKVPIKKCLEVTGKRPIQVRWIDVNKGDRTTPLYRSRLVAKEFNTGVRPDLFAATPPLEEIRLLMHKMATGKGKYKLLYADVSRAYFYARAVRPVFVVLPSEDTCSGEDELCGDCTCPCTVLEMPPRTGRKSTQQRLSMQDTFEEWRIRAYSDIAAKTFLYWYMVMTLLQWAMIET